MSGIPRVSGRECQRALERAGFRFQRQTGSHIILRRADRFAQVVVPNHRELDTGTLRNILRHAGLGIAEFKKLLG